MLKHTRRKPGLSWDLSKTLQLDYYKKNFDLEPTSIKEAGFCFKPISAPNMHKKKENSKMGKVLFIDSQVQGYGLKVKLQHT